MNRAGEDRRKFSRVWLPLEVSYTVVDKPDEKKTLVTKDIGGGGLRLALEEKLETGTLLKIEIELLKDKKAELDARVVWLKPAPDYMECAYEAGIEFINIGLEERIMIGNCLFYQIAK
ncbi:MAG: PilZ domain-containing protein [Candidatus Omnitrophota bacterium]